MKKLHILPVLAVGFLSAGCPGGRDSGTPGDPGPAIDVRFTPNGSRILVDESIGFSVSVTVDGVPDEDVTWTWSSADPGIAEVDPGGRVTGLSRGSARIVASSTEPGKYQGSVVVDVALPDILTIGDGSLATLPWEGGIGQPIDGASGVPALSGIAVDRNRGVYLLGSYSGLWFLDLNHAYPSALLRRPIEVDVPSQLDDGAFMTITTLRSLAVDSLGRIYLGVWTTDVGDRILQFDPATDRLIDYGPASAPLYLAGMAFDDQDNLYVLAGVAWTGDPLVTLIKPPNPPVTWASSPYASGSAAGGGIAVTGDGRTLFVAVFAYSVELGFNAGWVYRFDDGSEGIQVASLMEEARGILWNGEDLLIGTWGGILRQPGGAAGPALEPWSSTPAANTRTMSVFAQVRPW